MLEGILRSGGSALYLPTWHGELSHRLELIVAALEGRDGLPCSSVESDAAED